jgi:hypothetical protein
MIPRGGGDGSSAEQAFFSISTPSDTKASTSNADASPAYVTLSDPAPGTPFHYAFPVHDLDAAKQFYGGGEYRYSEWL